MRRTRIEARRRTSEGFTLIEITIAIAVFAAGMLSLSAMLLAATQGGSRGRHTTHASAIAEIWMEEIQRRSWDQLEPNGWSAPETKSDTANQQSYTVEWRSTELVAGWTRAVDVRVTWDEPGRSNRSVTFSSVRFNREGV